MSIKNRWQWGLLLGIGIILTPMPALANASTALVKTTIFHLFWGNLIIGYVEAGLLVRWFRLPRLKTTVTLILANYISTWGGIFVVVYALSLANHISDLVRILVVGYTLPGVFFLTLENIHIWSWIIAIFLFPATLLIEYPFFRFSLRKKPNATAKTVKSLLVIHAISHLLVAAWYMANSQTSMLTQLERVPADTLNLPGQYQLYFKSPDGSQAMQSDLTGSNIKSISSADFQTQLLTVPKEPESENRRLQRIGYDFHQPILKLAEDSDWDFYIRNLKGRGIAGLRDRNAEQFEFEFTLEIPFARWGISHATHLPGDFVVFQLGQDQICILHPGDRVIALVTRGIEPIVVATGVDPHNINEPVRITP